jgi:hypothetical protein
MLELTEFPYLPAGNPQKAVLAFIQACRDLPADGEQFRYFRTRMKQYRLWDQDRMQGTYDFLGINKSGTITPSALVRAIRAQKLDDKARELLAKRLWEVNPLLFKVILELLKERVHSRDEVIKHIDSFAYRGKKPSRPQLEAWLHMALGLDILKMVGIALDLGPRADDFKQLASDLEVEDFLDEQTETATWAAISAADLAGVNVQNDQNGKKGADGEDSDDSDDSDDGEDGDEAAIEPVATASRPAAAKPPAPPRAAAGTRPAQDTPLDVNVAELSPPRGREAPVSPSCFAGHAVFPDDVLDHTTERIQSWWSEQSHQRAGATAADFGLDAGAWMEGSEETLYRMAVAAALVFRLGRDRAAVKQVFSELDAAGVLGDLYHGTAPDTLPGNVDPRALMLASLVARRCAESPDLASTLEKQDSAAQAFAALDRALGRGLLRLELFWMMGALEDVGALRSGDLADFVALPRRLVRDTLFRLGYVDTPYAHDAASLVPAARAARRAAGTARPEDEALMAFALAAGCAYDCANRRDCEYACRERAE